MALAMTRSSSAISTRGIACDGTDRVGRATAKEVPKTDTAGPRHLCFQATSRDVVDAVGSLLTGSGATVLRGPVEMADYSQGYYTVDFRDPDGYVLEVAHTPNMAL